MAIGRVQYRAVYTGSPLAYNSNISAGSLLIALNVGYDINAATSSCSDNNSNTWHLVDLDYSAMPGGCVINMWYCWNANAGATTVTMNFANQADVGTAIFEYSGVDASADPLIDKSTLLRGATNPLVKSLTTEAGGMAFGCWHNDFTDDYVSMVAGLTEISNHEDGHWWAFSENISTSAGTVNAGANTGGDSNNLFVGVSFRAAGGGGGSSIKTVDSLVKANVKTFGGLAIASVKTINTLAKLKQAA